jgi:hypothetical protein
MSAANRNNLLAAWAEVGRAEARASAAEAATKAAEAATKAAEAATKTSEARASAAEARASAAEAATRKAEATTAVAEAAKAEAESRFDALLENTLMRVKRQRAIVDQEIARASVTPATAAFMAAASEAEASGH